MKSIHSFLRKTDNWPSKAEIINQTVLRVQSLGNDIDSELTTPSEAHRLTEEVSMLRELKNIMKNLPDNTLNYLFAAKVATLLLAQKDTILSEILKKIHSDTILTKNDFMAYNMAVYHLNEYWNIIESLI